MTSVTAIRRTALFTQHVSAGARLVDFHGWELPIQYTSILKEHQAVRNACGIFDVSHMGQVFVDGPGALDFLQRINANDIAKAPPGKAVYSHLLNERGGLVDDVIVSCLAKDRYLVVVNAATQDKDFAWMQKHSAEFDVRLKNRSDDLAMIALQGPAAVKVMEGFVPEAVALPKFGAMEKEVFGQPCVVTRTGYTGEDGFEVVCPNEIGTRVWQEFQTLGRSWGLAECGLGSRDTLRLEAGLLLYGQDVDDDHTPLEAGYGWVAKLDKGEFIGRDALRAQKRAGLTRKMTGVRLVDKGVPRPGAAVVRDGKRLGTLASATYSPTLQLGIGMGYLSDPALPVGERVTVELHGRPVAAEIVALPFYRRA